MTRHVAVDLDGTLASQDETGGPGDIGAPVHDVLARVNDELAAGNEVTIFTSRVDPDDEGADEARAAIESWCMEHLGTVLPVTAVKGRRFTEFWDDKAVPVRKVGRGKR